MMILGLVKWLQPVHGYNVRRELLSWNVSEWANIAPGSIYHALRKLTEEGLLEEVATEQVGARPARTTYRLTSHGDEEFERLLRQGWWQYRQPIDPFEAAFSFLPALPRREAVAALRHRATVLRSHGEIVRSAEETGWLAGKPVHVQWMFELSQVRVEAEIAWCERIADRVEAGEGLSASEVPEAFDEWRASFEK